MHTIYKYPFSLVSEQFIELPRDARPLLTGEQNGVPHLWAMVDPNAPIERRQLFVFGTGHPIDVAQLERYVNTFQDSRAMVWHVFMGTERR
jgi:hypothetical protein